MQTHTQGIQDFFRTHTCNAACRLLGLKEHVLPSVRSKGHKEDNPDVPTSNKKSSICKKSDKNNARKQFTVFCNETRPKIVQEHPEYTLECGIPFLSSTFPFFYCMFCSFPVVSSLSRIPCSYRQITKSLRIAYDQLDVVQKTKVTPPSCTYLQWIFAEGPV